jgi:hypothetical protein
MAMKFGKVKKSCTGMTRNHIPMTQNLLIRTLIINIFLQILNIIVFPPPSTPSLIFGGGLGRGLFSKEITMPTVKSDYSLNDASQGLDSIWLKVRTALEKQKKAIEEQIVSYPPPIPACDAQFNYLLEERARLSQELTRLAQLSARKVPGKEGVALLEAFASSSPYLDAAEYGTQS